MRKRQSTDKNFEQLEVLETVESSETATEDEEVSAETAVTETVAENQTEAALETEEPTEVPVPVTETPTEVASERETTTIVYVVRQLTGMTATATSQLEDYESYSYGASNLFDGSLSTAYVEGVDGVGTGEQITIDLDKTSCIDYIVWYPGYQISSDLLAKNGYPTALTFYFSDGTFVTSQFTGSLSIGTSVTVDVPDGMETSWICVEITGAVAGSKYEDTCISEMEIYGYEIQE